MDTKYDIEDSLLDAELKGEAKGIAKGETKKQREIAKALKAEGIPVSVIVKCTGLTEEQIKGL